MVDVGERDTLLAVLIQLTKLTRPICYCTGFYGRHTQLGRPELTFYFFPQMVNGLSELSSVFHLLCWHFALANVLEPPLLSRLVRTCLRFSRIGERKGTCPKTEPYPHNSEFTLNMSTTSSCQKPQVRFYFFLILRIVIVGRCTVTFRRRPMLAHREMCNVTFNTRLLAWLFFKTIFIC